MATPIRPGLKMSPSSGVYTPVFQDISAEKLLNLLGIAATHPANCPDCKGKGVITLLTSIVPCTRIPTVDDLNRYVSLKKARTTARLINALSGCGVKSPFVPIDKMAVWPVFDLTIFDVLARLDCIRIGSLIWDCQLLYQIVREPDSTGWMKLHDTLGRTHTFRSTDSVHARTCDVKGSTQP